MILVNSLFFALFVVVLTGLVSGLSVLVAAHEADAHNQKLDKSTNHGDGSSRSRENTDKPMDNNSDPRMRSPETQNIDCGGNLSTCQNVLTNIVCSHVTYCIIGNTTPFLMANPN